LRGENGLRLGKLGQDARAGFIERTARVREHEPARRPLEQHDAEPPFEPGDTLAHRRIREVQPLGRSGETARVGDTDEWNDALQMFGREARHC